MKNDVGGRWQPPSRSTRKCLQEIQSPVSHIRPRTHDALLLLVTADEALETLSVRSDFHDILHYPNLRQRQRLDCSQALVQRHYAGQAESVQCFHLNHTDRQVGAQSRKETCAVIPRAITRPFPGHGSLGSTPWPLAAQSSPR